MDFDVLVPDKPSSQSTAVDLLDLDFVSENPAPAAPRSGESHSLIDIFGSGNPGGVAVSQTLTPEPRVETRTLFQAKASEEVPFKENREDTHREAQKETVYEAAKTDTEIVEGIHHDIHEDTQERAHEETLFENGNSSIGSLEPANAKTLYDSKNIIYMQRIWADAAERLEVDPFSLIVPSCHVESLLALAGTCKKMRTLVIDDPIWKKYCQRIGIPGGFYEFLNAYRTFRPVIQNPPREPGNDQVLCDALKLASLINIDEQADVALRVCADNAHTEVLDDLSRAIEEKQPLRDIFARSVIWFDSGFYTNTQSDVFKLYFSSIMPSLEVSEAFTYNSDAEERQTSQRKIEIIFNKAASFLITVISDISDAASPIPAAWRKDAWSYALTSIMGALVIFFQDLASEVTQNISELEYLHTVPRVYLAADVLRKNSVLQERREYATDFNIQSYIETVLLKPMLDEFVDRQVTYIDKFAKEKVKDWNDSLSQRESETEEFLWSSVPRKSEKTDFMSSLKWAFSTKGSQSKEKEQSPEQSPETAESHETSAPATEFEAQTAVLVSKLKGLEKLVSFELAVEILDACRASVQRLITVDRLTSLAAEPLFLTYLQVVGQGHVKKAFEKAIKVLNAYDPKKYGRLMVSLDGVDEEDDKQSSYAVEPLVVFTELVNVADLIQQMVHVFFEEELVATKLVRPNNFGTPSVNAKRQFEQMLDDYLAEGLSRGIDVLMDQVEFTLATEQLGSDYLPVPTQHVVGGPTAACEKVIMLVKSHMDLLRDSTEKSLFDVFQQEVGMRLFAALSRHIKKQTVSIEGAINLISDANAYYQFIASLKQKNLTPYFEALKQVSQLFLIDKRDAKQIGLAIGDSARYKNVLTTEDVVEFIKRRQDWPQIKSKVDKVLYGLFDCIIS